MTSTLLDSGQNQDERINSKIAIAAYSILGALPFSMLLFLPMFVGGFVTDFGMSEKNAGFIASITMAGFAIAGLLAFGWVRKASIKKVVGYAFVFFIILNIISLFISSFTSLAIVRFAEGLASGTISAGVVASIGKTRNPDRNFGIWLAVQLLYGTIGFMIIPAIFTKFGVVSGFAGMALLGLFALAFVRYLPDTAGDAEEFGETKGFKLFDHPGWGVASILSFYIGLNIVWAFLERIGHDAGLSIEAIGSSLSIANFAGLIGALLIAAIGLKAGRLIPLTVGLILTALSVLPLLSTPDATTYTASVSVYLFGWCFLIPLMLGAVSEADSSGKYVALGNAAIGIGLSLGPTIGAILVGETEGYTQNIYLGCAFMLFSLVLIYPILLAKRAAK